MHDLDGYVFHMHDGLKVFHMHDAGLNVHVLLLCSMHDGSYASG